MYKLNSSKFFTKKLKKLIENKRLELEVLNKSLQFLAKDPKNPKEFNFDIVMANPPFAGDIKDSRLISNYEVAFDGKGKKANKVSRDVLFIVKWTEKLNQ